MDIGHGRLRGVLGFRKVGASHGRLASGLYRGVLFGCGALVCTGIVVWLLHRPKVHGAPSQTVVIVHRGESAKEVAAELARKRIIGSAFWFREFLRWTGQGGRIQAGFYRLPTGDSFRDVARRLTDGVDGSQMVRVTIPEGFTVKQIGQRLQSMGVCSAAAFFREERTDRSAFRLLSKFFPGIGPDARVKYPLEGYLFPDTYDMVRDEPASAVVRQMVSDFISHVLVTSTTAKGLDLKRIVTKASLVEREAKVESERPIIAGIIENRLKLNMPLQVDASVQYAVGKVESPSPTDVRIRDPFNTYLHRGLPPGPIANPGMASILAAMHPAKTPYLYYVVRNDGSGRNYFAKSYRTHLANIARSEANLRDYLHRQGQSRAME